VRPATRLASPKGPPPTHRHSAPAWEPRWSRPPGRDMKDGFTDRLSNAHTSRPPAPHRLPAAGAARVLPARGGRRRARRLPRPGAEPSALRRRRGRAPSGPPAAGPARAERGLARRPQALGAGDEGRPRRLLRLRRPRRAARERRGEVGPLLRHRRGRARPQGPQPLHRRDLQRHLDRDPRPTRRRPRLRERRDLGGRRPRPARLAARRPGPAPALRRRAPAGAGRGRPVAILLLATCVWFFVVLRFAEHLAPFRLARRGSAAEVQPR